jgi:hypothetical protein
MWLENSRNQPLHFKTRTTNKINKDEHQQRRTIENVGEESAPQDVELSDVVPDIVRFKRFM